MFFEILVIIAMAFMWTKIERAKMFKHYQVWPYDIRDGM